MGTRGRTYGGMPTDLRRAQRKDKLLAATVQLLGDIGVEQLTVRRIAAAAGLSSRSLYESFTGLDELVEEAFRHAAQQFEAEVESRGPAAGHDPRSQLAATVEAIVDFALAHPEELRLLSAGRPRRPAARPQSAPESSGEHADLTAFVHQRLAPAALSGLTGAFTAEFLAAGIAATTAAWTRDPRGCGKGQFIGEIANLTAGAVTAFDQPSDPDIT